jgi:signal transduction histidine kinase
LKFNLEIQEDYYLEVDKERFEQVLLNLISNAIKNTPAHGNITITLQKHETSVDIIIKDTGVGFTENEKAKIFKKFGKIERYGKGLDVDIQGSGLGLYISKKIIELHKGKIWIESEGKNKGSKVIVNLPIN